MLLFSILLLDCWTILACVRSLSRRVVSNRVGFTQFLFVFRVFIPRRAVLVSTTLFDGVPFICVPVSILPIVHFMF